jgi:hypothetical protein
MGYPQATALPDLHPSRHQPSAHYSVVDTELRSHHLQSQSLLVEPAGSFGLLRGQDPSLGTLGHLGSSER